MLNFEWLIMQSVWSLRLSNLLFNFKLHCSSILVFNKTTFTLKRLLNPSKSCAWRNWLISVQVYCAVRCCYVPGVMLRTRLLCLCVGLCYGVMSQFSCSTVWTKKCQAYYHHVAVRVVPVRRNKLLLRRQIFVPATCYIKFKTSDDMTSIFNIACAGKIWKRRFHSENASNTFPSHYAGRISE